MRKNEAKYYKTSFDKIIWKNIDTSHSLSANPGVVTLKEIEIFSTKGQRLVTPRN